MGFLLFTASFTINFKLAHFSLSHYSDALLLMIEVQFYRCNSLFFN